MEPHGASIHNSLRIYRYIGFNTGISFLNFFTKIDIRAYSFSCYGACQTDLSIYTRFTNTTNQILDFDERTLHIKLVRFRPYRCRSTI
jgi:hypothetical protein